MNDRFAYLVEKYLENCLEEKEKAEFEYYLGMDSMERALNYPNSQ